MVRNFHEISRFLTIYMVFDVNKNIEVQFKFFEDIRHARESLHLENKNMLRAFLGLKLKKKLRTSEGFLLFWCSYKKTCTYHKNTLMYLNVWKRNHKSSNPECNLGRTSRKGRRALGEVRFGLSLRFLSIIAIWVKQYSLVRLQLLLCLANQIK